MTNKINLFTNVFMSNLEQQKLSLVPHVLPSTKLKKEIKNLVVKDEGRTKADSEMKERAYP